MKLNNKAVITYQEDTQPRRIYVFLQGVGHLYLNYWNGFEWQWADQGTPPGTTVADTPGVVTYREDIQPQRIYAFVRGANGHLYLNYWNGSDWQWADQGIPPGTTVADTPSVVTYREGIQPQRIYAFVKGANGHLYLNYWNGSDWQWADQGTPIFTKVAPNSSPGGITYREADTQRIYAFVMRANTSDVVPPTLNMNYWNGSKWQWADQGAPEPVFGSVAVTSYQEADTQRIYAFVAGTNNHLYLNYWNGSEWQWADQGTPFGLPQQNTAIYLGWKGQIDTHLDFSEFFANDHTIMAWFMPQYPHAYEGPIFAENGGGIYLVGQGNYRWGDGGFEDSGNPVLFIQVGEKRVVYLVPEFQQNVWRHIAVVRQNNKFKLFVDGNHKMPVIVIDKENNITQPDKEIELTGGEPSLPVGTLRFGRRTTGNANSMQNWQTYGLLDDVAVFKQALSWVDINAIKSGKRLTGWEDELLAGWCFDQPGANEKPLPPLLTSWCEDNSRAYRVNVSAARNSVSDASHFNNPFIIGETQVALHLPFHINEVWYVVQGYDAKGGSHNGTAAFSYDFKLYKNPDLGAEYPNGTTNAPILTSCLGKAVLYLKNSPAIDGQDTNWVTIRQAEGEYIRYLHLAMNSLPAVISGGILNEKGFFVIPENQAPFIQQGSSIGKVGSTSKHLHWAGKNGSLTPITIPMAFANYWASDDGGQSWIHVWRGHPKAGQLIKREQ